jgi:hypothetical protein
MLGGMKVFGGVFVFRIVATTHVSADQAHSQMDPVVADFQTIFATACAGLNLADLSQMCASWHGVNS